MIHPISDSRLSILGSCIFLLLAMPRLARSLLSKLSPLQYLPSSSRPTPKPKPSHPTLLDGLSAISHVLVVVVASNLACGGPAFETRLFITLRQQLLEFSRPAALLAASTPIPVPRRNSKRIASVRDEKLEPEALGRCDSAQPQPAEKTAPIPTQDNSASPSPSSAPVVHPSPPSAPVIHPSPPSAAHSQPSPPSAPLSRPPPIPRRSSSLNKAFDARRIKLVVSASPSSSPSSSFSSISSSSDRESRARRRPEMAVKGGDTFRVTLSEKKSGDPRLDARVRMELDPGHVAAERAGGGFGEDNVSFKVDVVKKGWGGARLPKGGQSFFLLGGWLLFACLPWKERRACLPARLGSGRGRDDAFHPR